MYVVTKNLLQAQANVQELMQPIPFFLLRFVSVSQETSRRERKALTIVLINTKSVRSVHIEAKLTKVGRTVLKSER